MSVTLTVGGKNYSVFSSVRVTRGLKRVASDFQFETPQEAAMAILPFSPCTIADGGDLLLTGYIDALDLDIPAVPPVTAIVRGRSKTADLVDCMPLLATNQFLGYRLDAMARTLGRLFGIGVVVNPGTDLGDPFPDATFERTETAFGFLERLAKQRGVMLTDDENGNLVLTGVGTVRAATALATGKGGNIARARGQLRFAQRFSEYTIRSQVGITDANSYVITDIEGRATDGAVPRFRPWAGLAESALMPGDAQLRAAWEAAHRAAEGISAVLTVPEWRQKDGTLWRTNLIAECNVPRLANLAGDMLIAQIDYRQDNGGKRVDLSLGPPAAYTPEPGTTPEGVWQALINVGAPLPGAGGNALP